MDKMSKVFFMICVYFLINSVLSDGIKYKKRPDSRDSDYSGAQVIRVVPTNPNQLNFLRSSHSSQNVVFWMPPTRVGRPVDILVDPEQRQLEKPRLRRRALIHDLGTKVRKTGNISSFSSLSEDFFSKHQRLDAIYKLMDELETQNLKLASVSPIGKSYEMRDIKMIKIGVNHKSEKKPIIYIDGGTHAREWAGVSTASYIIHNLIKHFNHDQQDVKTLLNKYDFYIVPVVNPDGYEYTHTEDRMWRKNRAVNEGVDCIGTDLNRNYDFHWGGEGSSHDPCDDTFCGSKPFSEPESRAVSKLILDNKSRIKAFVTLHAYGQYFLFPWGYTEENSPVAKELKRVADISAKALYSVHKTKYTVGSASQVLYVSQGSDDWAHGVAKIPYVYCLEMRDKGRYSFLLPASQIIPTGEETYVGIKALVKAIRDSNAGNSSKRRRNQSSTKGGTKRSSKLSKNT